MFFHHPGFILQNWIYPSLTWRKSVHENTLFLTFDDGPIPKLTAEILSILRAYKVKATFFCVGDNVRKHPKIFEQLIAEGHKIGNHTFHHLKGWYTSFDRYMADTTAAEQQMANFETVPSRLFRPPHGQLTFSQIAALQPYYEIVMWDVLTGDYSQKISPPRCLAKSIQYSRSGSIVVFHDNYKATENVLFTLPRYIEHFLQKGWQFGLL